VEPKWGGSRKCPL